MGIVVTFGSASYGISDGPKAADCRGEVSEPDERKGMPGVMEAEAAAVADCGKVGLSGFIDNCTCASTQGDGAVGDINRRSGDRSRS